MAALAGAVHHLGQNWIKGQQVLGHEAIYNLRYQVLGGWFDNIYGREPALKI